mmetsp:Transcript_29958/g.45814  ORF Transcript_29958/g.45814 Transcript_29958/m.45814 type:complete len:118 (-) Transcript_29958:275-628(-)
MLSRIVSRSMPLCQQQVRCVSTVRNSDFDKLPMMEKLLADKSKVEALKRTDSTKYASKEDKELTEFWQSPVMKGFEMHDVNRGDDKLSQFMGRSYLFKMSDEVPEGSRIPLDRYQNL